MRRRVRVSRGRIRRYVDRALDSLPAQFREAADNVMVVVENRPRPADETKKRGRSNEPLMGIYRGVPLSERAGYQLVTPDVIAIFRKPLLSLCRTRHEVEAEVRLTVLHEFGHFLGLTEEQVEHL
jgi:predicted Zn-dependent protease with MMP-like domain